MRIPCRHHFPLSINVSVCVFVCLLAMACSMWDLISLTRDRTHDSFCGSRVLTTGSTGKSSSMCIFFITKILIYLIIVQLPKSGNLTLTQTNLHLSALFRFHQLSQSYPFSSVQSLSCVQLFATPWTAARQALLSFTISRSLCKLMSIESVMPSKYLILYCRLRAIFFFLCRFTGDT